MMNTQLRSFLGVANYFKDFVPNHSNVVSPLFKMVDHSAKNKNLSNGHKKENMRSYTFALSLLTVRHYTSYTTMPQYT